MSNVVHLFNQPAAVQPFKKSRHQHSPRQAGAGVKFSKYLAQRNGVFYFKRRIPANLVHAFENQAQLWKSLGTSDFSLACRNLTKECAAFELRIATVRLRMANEGLSITPASNVSELREEMIPVLLQHHYVHMLTSDEQELQSMRPLTSWSGPLHSRPKYWGKLVIELIYDTLDPDVAKYLRENRPPAGVHWHRQLTDNHGTKQLVSRCLKSLALPSHAGP